MRGQQTGVQNYHLFATKHVGPGPRPWPWPPEACTSLPGFLNFLKEKLVPMVPVSHLFPSLPTWRRRSTKKKKIKKSPEFSHDLLAQLGAKAPSPLRARRRVELILVSIRQKMWPIHMWVTWYVCLRSSDIYTIERCHTHERIVWHK